MAERTEAGGQRWAARPWAARIIKAIAFLAPIVLSVLISLAISRRIDPPSSRWGQIGWWIVLSAIATGVLFVFDKISRRLMPLSALFGLSLIFPDQAPSRFRTALRTGTVSQLRRRIEDAKANGLSDDPTVAAETLVELAGALSIHDRLTRGHSERVRAYTKLIAEEMGLPEDEVDRLQWAGLAHDVGKLFVDGDILNKPGRLTDDEFETIKSHTVKGAELVAPLRGWLGDALDAVDQHHERWDGKGYPAGLAKTDIALPGRIVAVADVFDVITSVRSYKSAQGVAEAREELIRCSGTQFDPRVVRAFLNIGLGRLRLLVGPLSWLAQLPVVGRAPVGAAAAPAVAALGTSFSLLFGGFFGQDAPTPPREEVITLTAAPAPAITTTTTTTTTPASTTTTEPVPIMVREDVVTTDEDTAVTIDVLANDDGELRLDSVSSPRPAGTATVLDDGRIRFTPAADWSGTSTFAYRARGADGVMRLANVTVEVVPVSDAPRTGADRATLTEDGGAISVDVLGNDSTPDGGTLRITSVSTDSAGTASTDGTKVTFVPAADQTGTVVLTYTVIDERGVTATGKVTLTIDPVNDAPVAADDFTRIDEDTPWALIDVRANDTDVDGDALAITGVSGAAIGTATVDGGRIRYVPDPNANGTERLTYTVADGHGGSAAAVLVIAVSAVDDAPTVTTGSSPTVAEDAGAQTRTGWATDIGPGGGPDEAGQTLTATTTATNAGLFSVLPVVDVTTGTLRFTPAPDATGKSVVTLRVGDGTNTTTVSFTITITPVNDAPTITAGTDPTIAEDAGAQTLTAWATNIGPGGGPDETTQTLTATTTATDATLFSTQPALDPATGDLAYTPADDANGSTLVTIGLSDGTNTTTVSFTITITPVNDAPVAADDAVTIAEDDPATIIDVLANDTDTEGDPLTITAVTGATLGTATTDGTTITYTPNPDANGTDTLTTTIDDGNGGTDTATLTITITPVDDAPTITLGTDPTIAEDAGEVDLEAWASLSPGGGTDESTQTLTITVTATDPSLFVEQPTLDADGELEFEPAPNANGSTLVTIGLSDGTNTTTVSFTITITPVNDAPVAADDTATLTEDDPATIIDVLANDTDTEGDPLTITAVTGATLGTATTDGTTITYTPNPDANGTDTLTTTIDDGNGGTDTATLTITITPVNDAPVAGDDGYSTDVGVDLVVAAPGLLGNDSDHDGDSLSVVTAPAVAPTSGTVTLAADGSFTYSTTSPTFVGTDSFTYTVTDGNGGTDTATVDIVVDDGLAPARYYLGSTGPSASTFTLNPSPGPPAVVEPDYSDPDTNPGFTIKDGNDSLTETDPSKFQHWTLGTSVPLAFKGPVAVDLWSTTAGFDSTKDMDYSIWLHDCAADGTDCQLLTSTVSVHVDDWNGGSSTWVNRVLPVGSIDHTLLPGRQLRLRLMFDHTDAWIALSGTRPSALDLTLANATPSATDDAETVLEDASTATFDVLANDVDINLDPASVSISSPPTKGLAVARGDGQIDYTPTADVSGADSFVYEVCDTSGLCDTATVAVAITPVNDRPSFQPGGPVSADEDDGRTSVDPWATSIVAGPADEVATQTTWFEVTNDNPALFEDQPVVEPDGKLTFKGAPDAFGSATVTVTVRDDGGTADGGIDAGVPADFVITIDNVNDAPVSADDTATVSEDDPATAIDVLANDGDIDGDTLTITTVTGAALGTATTDGTTITYTPNPDANGTDTLTTTIDDGNGGTDTATLTITITPVNDAPTFVIGPSVNGTAGSGPQAIADWVTGISAGPGEAGQTVAFEVTVDLPGLFTVDPSVDASGTLTFTPGAVGGGTATISVVATDDGGTAGGGVDRTAAQTATITIAGTGNTPPVAVDDTALTNTLLAVNVNHKPNDTDADGDELTLVSFTQPPNGAVTVTGGGTLRYTSLTNFWGVDTFEYTITDGRGGFDSATVTVTVNSVPVAVPDIYVVGAGPTVLDVTANDFDLDGDPLDILAADTALTNGSVTCGATTCTYTPGSFRGVDTFRYRLRDTRGGTSAWATVTVTVL